MKIKYKDIFDEIDNLDVIDSHDHLISDLDRREMNIFNYFLPVYINSDIISAGMEENIMHRLLDSNDATKNDIEDLFHYWDKTKNTVFSKTVLKGIEEIHGIGDLNIESYLELEDLFEKTKDKKWNQKVFRKAKIEKCINISLKDNVDDQLNIDRSIFAPVAWLDHLINIFKKSDIAKLEEEADISVHSIEDILKVFDKIFKKILEDKAAAIKLTIAYTRSLRIRKVSKYDAEKCFNRLFDRSFINVGFQEEKGLSPDEMLPLQDYLIHHILQFAEVSDIPLKVHTGYQEGNNNYISNSNPTYLYEVIKEYKRINFVLLHAGYPYTDEAICMGKSFKNVFIDTCWLHIITPTEARSLLSKLIESVPSNKVFGFGGDFQSVEGTYGSLIYTKENIAKVLFEKVNEKYFTKNEAIGYAKKILYDNPKEFYKL